MTHLGEAGAALVLLTGVDMAVAGLIGTIIGVPRTAAWEKGTGSGPLLPPPIRSTPISGPDWPPITEEQGRQNQSRERRGRDHIPHGTVLSKLSDSPGPGLTRVYKGVI